jgi:hypothetical protein
MNSMRSEDIQNDLPTQSPSSNARSPSPRASAQAAPPQSTIATHASPVETHHLFTTSAIVHASADFAGHPASNGPSYTIATPQQPSTATAEARHPTLWSLVKRRVDWSVTLMVALAALGMTVYYGQIQVFIARRDAKNNELQTCLSWIGKNRTSERCSHMVQEGPAETWKRHPSPHYNPGVIVIRPFPILVTLLFLTGLVALYRFRRRGWPIDQPSYCISDATGPEVRPANLVELQESGFTHYSDAWDPSFSETPVFHHDIGQFDPALIQPLFGFDKGSPHLPEYHDSTTRKSQRRSSHRPGRYDTIVIDADVQAQPSPEPLKEDSRRGSLYDTDIQRQKKDKSYIVEVREPRRRTERQRRKDERSRYL